MPQDAVPAAARQHLLQLKTSFKGESGHRGPRHFPFLQLSLALGIGALEDRRPEDTLPSRQYNL